MSENKKTLVDLAKWEKQFAVVSVTNDDDFQTACDEAATHHYTIHSWRNFFHEEVGYGATIIFEQEY